MSCGGNSVTRSWFCVTIRPFERYLSNGVWCILRSMRSDNLLSSSSSSGVGNEPVSSGGTYSTGALSAEPASSTALTNQSLCDGLPEGTHDCLRSAVTTTLQHAQI